MVPQHSGLTLDRIIRGGENISPSAVEAVLSKNAILSVLLPQIVGAPDEIAGEVPVCVVKGKGKVTPEIRELIQSEIVHHMGTLYVPEDVISIEDLGLKDYPRTTSGKIQKTKIAGMVKKYLSMESETNGINGHLTNGEDVNLAEKIRTIWAKAVGLDPSKVRLDAAIGEFADSITVMRVRDRIKRETGKALSLAEMSGASTIEQQIDILQSMGSSQVNGNHGIQVRRPTRQGPPGPEDMAHLTENPGLFEPTKEVVSKTLSGYGLGWEDVEDVMPAYDFGAVMSQTKLYDSWNFNFSFTPTNKVNKTVSLSSLYHPVLPSFLHSVDTNDGPATSPRFRGRGFEQPYPRFLPRVEFSGAPKRRGSPCGSQTIPPILQHDR